MATSHGRHRTVVFNELELTGRTRTHVVWLQLEGIELHRSVVAPFRALCAAARGDGIRLAAASGFRDFERQMRIWNAKLGGERRLLDRDGAPLATVGLREAALVEAVMAWSALPGASRHHWGSDIDVYDASVAPSGQETRLTPSDWRAGGIYHHADRWLHGNVQQFGFYRPYDRDRGGVCAEPWHISHIDVSSQAMAQLRIEMIEEALTGNALAGQATILAQLPRLVDRYVYNVPPAAT